MTKCLRWLLTAAMILIAAAGCAPTPKEKTPLVVFAAGSLIQPFDALEAAYEKAHPDVDVLNEFHGSIQVMRHATELHEEIDVVATADDALIPLLMYNRNDPATGKPYAAWALRFATNRLGIAYTERSRYADEVTSENIWEILTRPDVRVGIADPRFDASGYRAMMVFTLAQGKQAPADLFDQMFDGQFRYPVMLVGDGQGGTLIHIPEILETKKDAHVVIRGASIQLIALLESGDLDYAFEYESVIQQHGLKLAALPPELNRGEAGMDDLYGQATVKLDLQRFASVKPEFRGEQIGYGITVPANAPHPEAAVDFIAFLLGPEGRQIMESYSHPIFEQVTADHWDQVPAKLQPLVTAAP